VGRGTTIATNLAAAPGENNDPSQCDPLPSSFWTRPPNIADQDLYIGFGRSQVPSLADELCTYDGPKTSSGTRAGFDVECNGTRYKIKFGEVSSEPFTARLFHALGYHVDPTDFTPQVKVRYDRRVLREFNLRRPLTMRVRPLGIPMGSFALQPRYDPFKFIVAAVFRDGHSISGPELKKLLLHDPDANRAEETPQNFREDVEAALDCLIMSPANVQADETAGETIGPWAFVGLGHEHLRELRGAALLAGWLGWSDSRWDNTRLRAAGNRDGPPLLQHFFTDLGAGMGGDAYGFTQHGEDPNEFTWTFTRAAIVRGPGRMTTPFRVVDFRTMVPTPAFREMNVDDARWMARLIGQLTEEQIRAALIGSGYDAAEARLYQEKLVSRRDQMVRDLNLAAEIPLLRPGGVNRRLTLDPETDGPLTVVLKSGGKATARSSSRIVREGQVRDSTSLQDTSD
jgi:hypothetical protein